MSIFFVDSSSSDKLTMKMCVISFALLPFGDTLPQLTLAMEAKAETDKTFCLRVNHENANESWTEAKTERMEGSFIRPSPLLLCFHHYEPITKIFADPSTKKSARNTGL